VERAARVERAVMNVTVVYALADSADIVHLRLTGRPTIAQAIAASAISERHPELQLADIQVGIFSRGACLDTVLRDGDRIEIYRALQVDPMEARRRRVAKRGPVEGAGPIRR
jgi:uncharacterized protein